jgi:hypothetical protein
MEKLADSRQLYQFLRKVFDIKTWVKEKTQLALDESYYELSNLQNKIQKHSSFEAEIAANKPRYGSVTTVSTLIREYMEEAYAVMSSFLASLSPQLA